MYNLDRRVFEINGISDQLIDQLQEKIDEYNENKDEDIVGIDITSNKTEKINSSFELRVHRKNKSPLKRGISKDIVTEYKLLSDCEHLCCTHYHYEVLRSGQCIGIDVASGTLGLPVLVDTSGFIYKGILTCAHVLDSSINDEVYQPYCSENKIGEVDRYKLLRNEFGDAGIIWQDNNQYDLSIEGNVRHTLVSERFVRLNENLTKSGSVSGITNGIVDGIGVYKIKYYSKEILFQGFRVVPVDDGTLSTKGDSGSVFFSEKDSKGVGLLFAGEDRDGFPESSICCHLPIVFEKLKLSWCS